MQALMQPARNNKFASARKSKKQPVQCGQAVEKLSRVLMA